MSAASVSPLLKICGIMTEHTLQGMDGLPVDYIGFIFAKSRRQVSPEKAAALIAAGRATKMANGRPPRFVGVFVDPTLSELESVLAVVPLDVVQLHGKSETPAFCIQVKERFNLEVWRALPADAADGSALDHAADLAPDAPLNGIAVTGAGRLAAYADTVSAVLIDTAGGGTGRVFNWDVIPFYEQAAQAAGLKLFVAGGLHPDNVKDLLTQYAPDGVDISSGVETEGVKDNAKIAVFTERVKSQ